MDLFEALAVAAGRRRLLVASDFDGVLSEIVPEPDDARPVEGVEEVLARLVGRPRVRVALVSGRRLDDLRSRFSRLPDEVITVGEHGAAWPDRRFEPNADLDAIQRALEDIVDDHPGSHIERKHTAVTYHFRNVDGDRREEVAEETRNHLESLIAGMQDPPRLETGRGVIEAVVGGVTKSDAVEELRGSFDADVAVYFGDDVSDEPVFAGFGPDDVSVKVGSQPSVATHRVAEPGDVVKALEHLASLR